MHDSSTPPGARRRAALVYLLGVLAAVAKPPRPPAVTIAVTAYDWWWKADYGGGPPDGFTTANELHVPVGEPVLIELRSADVIHAFWAPQLAGKTQAIPGQINRQWMQADRPGVYRGQCTQFCGAQHAQMGFEIVAEPPDAYRRWYASQRRGAGRRGPAAPPAARESVAESAFESVRRGKTARAARVGRISTSGCPFSTGAPFYGQRCWAAPASAGGSAGGTRPARPRRANTLGSTRLKQARAGIHL